MTEQCDKSSVNRPETIREIRYEITWYATAWTASSSCSATTTPSAPRTWRWDTSSCNASSRRGDSSRAGCGCAPVYHRVAHRIDAHIALTVWALLLERMAEHACVDTWRNIRDDLKQIKLAQLIGPNGTLWQVTEPRPSASNRLKLLQIRPPATILKLG